MKNTAATLQMHSIESRESNGRLEALDVMTDADRNVTTEWVDVTGWDRQSLLNWLGY